MRRAALTRLIEEAGRRGQTVIIPPPDPQPARGRDEAELAGALCVIFGLARTEGLVLAQLLNNDYRSPAQLHGAAGQPMTLGTVRVIICVLRRKLAEHGVEIVNVWALGYGLRKEDRAKLRQLLTEHDEAVALP